MGAKPRRPQADPADFSGTVSYFIGDDRRQWKAGIPTYSKVRYSDIYPSVDVVYYGNQDGLEFDFIVAPGGRPGSISLNMRGADRLRVDGHGNLVAEIADGASVQLHRPVAYQEINGRRVEVAAAFQVDQTRVAFRLGAYDVSRPLTIDPALVYAERMGGSEDAAGYAVAVDKAGNAYITGDTNGDDFPVARPLQATAAGSTDAFVAKLSPGGKLLYATYLGGSGGDVGFGIAIDSGGNAYVTGDTTSADFPTINPAQSRSGGESDVFVAKISADGSKLLYSTYIGGSDGERGNGIAVDSAGSAYVTGYTNSADFPTRNAIQPSFAGGNADAFVFKLSTNGSRLEYSTFLGGGNDRPDIGTAIAVDSSGSAYVTGFTNSRDFPTRKPLQSFVGPTDVFVTKLSPSGTDLVYSTHLGGGADDEAMGIAVDSDGNAYVTGETESPDFPTTPGAFSTKCSTVSSHSPVGDICAGGDAFVTKISADGSKLLYSTFLHGSGFEVGRAIAVDGAGNAYVVGLTNSTDFPIKSPLQNTYGGGDYDGFVAKLNASGSAVVFSTYMGGKGRDGAYGVAVSADGKAYVIGLTDSPDFAVFKQPNNLWRKGKARSVFITAIDSK